MAGSIPTAWTDLPPRVKRRNQMFHVKHYHVPHPPPVREPPEFFPVPMPELPRSESWSAYLKNREAWPLNLEMQSLTGYPEIQLPFQHRSTYTLSLPDPAPLSQVPDYPKNVWSQLPSVPWSLSDSPSYSNESTVHSNRRTAWSGVHLTWRPSPALLSEAAR